MFIEQNTVLPTNVGLLHFFAVTLQLHKLYKKIQVVDTK